MRFLPAFAAALLGTTQAKIYHFPNEVISGEVLVRYISDDAFDAPQVGPLNGSTYDWWYFDAVSSTSIASVALVLYRSTPGGFPYALEGSTASVNLFITRMDGIPQYYPIPNLPGNDGAVTISTDGQGASRV